jgi:hypothetical protein
MSPQFNNMNELTSYLDTMEKRVQMLEGQNDFLTRSITKVDEDAAKVLPKTGLLNHSFMKRAFTVWGHNFIAQLIISLVIGIILATVLLIPGLFTAVANFVKGIPVP